MIYDKRVAITTDNDVLMNTTNSLVLPNSSAAISSPSLGQMRYNTGTAEVEIYQGTTLGSATWRAIRFKEATPITQQLLGYGDASTVYFGPLNPAPPTVVQSGTSWSGANLIVLVENVIQLFTTNYTIEQNPSIAGEVYTPKTSGITSSGATTINFDPTATGYIVYPAVDITGAIVTGSAYLQSNTAILTYTTNTSGQLTSITINKPTITSSISSGTMLTITDSTNTGSGYFVKFSSAVPLGKPVVVLHGFDK